MHKCGRGRRGHLVSLLSVYGGGGRGGGGWGVCMGHNMDTLSGPCIVSLAPSWKIVWLSRPCKLKGASRNYTALKGFCSVLYQSPLCLCHVVLKLVVGGA